MKDLIIIKFGGSVITQKENNLPLVRQDIINNLAQEINQILDTGKYQIILVHGAGSFGHPIAKKYNLQNGMKTFEQKMGFALTDEAMVNLNTIIVNTLLRNNIPSISLPPRAFATQNNKQLNKFDTKLIKEYLDSGITPVLFGDAVLDEVLGCSILSGDIIVPHLANELKAQRVIFLSDVDGVFDSNPKNNKNAKLIKQINDQNINQILQQIVVKNLNDVTGEMKGKIESIKKNLPGKDVFVISGLIPNNLEKLFKEHNIGTKLRFD